MSWSIFCSRTETISLSMNKCVSSSSLITNDVPKDRDRSKCSRNCFIAGSLQNKQASFNQHRLLHMANAKLWLKTIDHLCYFAIFMQEDSRPFCRARAMFLRTHNRSYYSPFWQYHWCALTLKYSNRTTYFYLLKEIFLNMHNLAVRNIGSSCNKTTTVEI